MNQSLSIVIVHFRTKLLTAACLESIARYHLPQTQYKTEVIVVDNDSGDGSVMYLKKHFPWVKFILSPENVGFAGGNNLALEKIDTTFTMLLNSDTELKTAGSLDQLIGPLLQHPGIGIVTPHLVMANGQLDPACHRGDPTPWRAFCYFSKLSKLFPKSGLFNGYHQGNLNLQEGHYIEACSGAAMMIRTSAMRKVGYLDQRFFMYAEDLDWCRRFRVAEFLIWYEPSVTILHQKYQSGQQHVQHDTVRFSTFHFYVTMLQYYAKYYPQPWHRVAQRLAHWWLRKKYQQEIPYVVTTSHSLKD